MGENRSLIPPNEWVGISENRSGLPGEIGQNNSALVKTGSKLGQIGQNGPSEHQIQGKKPRNRGNFLTKRLHGGTLNLCTFPRTLLLSHFELFRVRGVLGRSRDQSPT